MSRALRAGAVRRLLTPLALLLVLLGAGRALASVAVRGDGPEELADSAMDQLDDALDHYDYAAMQEALVDIDAVYVKVSDKTRKKLDKSLAAVFSTRPAREIDWEDRTLDSASKLLPAYQLAVGLLFDKDSGAKLFTDALKQKHVKDWSDARALLVEALGQRKDDGLVSLIGGYLTDESPDVVASAARALGHYSEASQDVRRSCTKLLIDAWMEHHEAAEKEEKRSRGKEEAKADFLVRVEGAFSASLTSIARQTFIHPTEWRDWFAEHGSEDTF
ncbi:MAG: hypothetical protein H6825_06295 [Planctomycetes bacterium]|nr:hypothetical protein [Planctomycetota bacterium]